MKFRQWLESNSDRNVQFGGFWKDGTIIVYINGKRYVYYTDAVYHDRWQRMLHANYPGCKWDILSQIKKCGDLLEPAQKEIQDV